MRSERAALSCEWEGGGEREEGEGGMVSAEGEGKQRERTYFSEVLRIRLGAKSELGIVALVLGDVVLVEADVLLVEGDFLLGGGLKRQQISIFSTG
jgi:hypothetical protein